MVGLAARAATTPSRFSSWTARVCFRCCLCLESCKVRGDAQRPSPGSLAVSRATKRYEESSSASRSAMKAVCAPRRVGRQRALCRQSQSPQTCVSTSPQAPCTQVVMGVCKQRPAGAFISCRSFCFPMLSMLVHRSRRFADVGCAALFIQPLRAQACVRMELFDFVWCLHRRGRGGCHM